MALKILTVDDSKTIRMIVKKAFRQFNCEMFEAENGIEGLAAANKEKPDLIVLDITMPVMNGTEMLEKLKSEDALKDIPVIMLTAESGKDNVMQIVKMGVNDYMVKPFKGEQLIERVEKILTLEPKKEEKAAEDTARKYFSQEDGIQILLLPSKITRPISVEIDSHLNKKLEEMKTSGFKKFILDLRKVSETNVSLIKLILLIIQKCEKEAISIRLVGSPAVGKELKSFQETSEIPLDFSIHDAKVNF
ncbi:MAG: response regulator [Thermodesulfobacteriota bacterium]|nr:response regulator [Thermodesulfobacteriota bacterium]